MQTIIEALRSILGEADFYKVLEGSSYNNPSWDYSAMIEYMFAGTVLCIVISWVFRLIKEGFS